MYNQIWVFFLQKYTVQQQSGSPIPYNRHIQDEIVFSFLRLGKLKYKVACRQNITNRVTKGKEYSW